MSQLSEKSYSEFFKEDLYEGFVQYLLDKFTARHVNDRLRSQQLISKKGVHPEFRKDFNSFLSQNPAVLKTFSQANFKFLGLRNIEDGPLRFPIDPSDDILMVREDIRVAREVPSTLTNKKQFPRARKEDKIKAQPMQGILMSNSDLGERKYLHPKRLTVHFKDGFANRIGKTTESFMVDSRSDAMDILINRYGKKVAFAVILGEEEFAFVGSRNGKRKRNRKLRG